MPTRDSPQPCRCPRCLRQGMHPPRCGCPCCWGGRRRRLRMRVVGPGSALHNSMAGSRNSLGIEVARPEDHSIFDLPSVKSGVLWAMGGVGAMIALGRISREVSEGKRFDETVDGVITSMALYAVLEHMRKIHNSAIPKPS
jgi:hypothetical protein